MIKKNKEEGCYMNPYYFYGMIWTLTIVFALGALSILSVIKSVENKKEKSEREEELLELWYRQNTMQKAKVCFLYGGRTIEGIFSKLIGK